MTCDQLKKTKWAKELKIARPLTYGEAYGLALNPDLIVFIVRGMDGIGWCIRVSLPQERHGFYLAYRMPTRKSCIELCKEMVWKVRR